jgi:beta-glucanase (GH16 family)
MPLAAGGFRPSIEGLEERLALNAPGAGWNLFFDDEFTGASLDYSKWHDYRPWGGQDNGSSYMVNHNTTIGGVNLTSDLSVSGGELHLKTQHTPAFTVAGTTYTATSAMITTGISPYTSFSSGYFEIRARLPQGPSNWPAFWMTNGWPPEDDIMEWKSSGGPWFHQGLYGMDHAWHDYSNTGSAAPPANWHTYAMEWGPGFQSFYVDDHLMYSTSGSFVPGTANPQYLLLGSGTTSSAIDNSADNTLDVDYVRVYGYTPTSGPAVVNAGFEQGTAGWALSGNAAVVNYNQRTGLAQLRMDGGTGYAQQVITGLTPNTTYTLSGWDRVSSGASAARIGVNNYGGTDTWVDNHATGYTREAVTFTTGPTSTQATIYCSHPISGNAAEFDDLDLVQTTAASPIPDLTTNIGTPTGTVPFTLSGTAAKFAAVSAVSDNPSLVPTVVFGGSGSQRTVTITPAPRQAGTAIITVTVTDPVWGGSTTSSFVVNVVNPGLPSPWWNQDIGVVGFSGSASTDGFTYTVQGSGADIWNRSDGFQFVYQPVTGDGSIIAHVASQDNTGGYAKAGVMIRESLDPGSKHALVDLTPSHGTEFIRRTATGASAVSNFHTGTAVPYWVRLDRSGNTLTAYDSADGVNWNLVGSATVPMAQAVYAGLAVCAFNNAALNTSTFDNVFLSWDQVSVDLSSSFNQVGSVTDGTPFSGGLDGNGDAYSATLLGSTLAANGYAFNLGAADGANVVQAAGQTVSLPEGQFGVLSFLGTGVNGPQPGQTFVVNYTDGSSDTFTQDLSDWLTPQGYAGEAVAAQLSYYNAADGSSPAVANYLYQYSFALNNQKTVSSITLPANGNVTILAIDLSVSPPAPSPAPTPSAPGHAFNLAAADSADVVQAAAQAISLPAGQFTVQSPVSTGTRGCRPGQTFAGNGTWIISPCYRGRMRRGVETDPLEAGLGGLTAERAEERFVPVVVCDNDGMLVRTVPF